MMPVLALFLFGLMFLVIFVGRMAIQKRRTGDSGLRTGGLSASAGSVEAIAAWLLIVALLTAVAAPVAELAGLEPWTTNPVVSALGVAIAVIGLLMTFLAQLDMGSEWRIGVDTEERTELVTNGIFATSRNPIFAAMILAATGLTLMVPNLIAVLGVVVLTAAVELQVRKIEEPHLERLHGKAYVDYRQTTGRFVPGVGTS